MDHSTPSLEKPIAARYVAASVAVPKNVTRNVEMAILTPDSLAETNPRIKHASTDAAATDTIRMLRGRIGNMHSIIFHDTTFTGNGRGSTVRKASNHTCSSLLSTRTQHSLAVMNERAAQNRNQRSKNERNHVHHTSLQERAKGHGFATTNAIKKALL
eukprot:362012-Chlamydomonas_euryale.AAC.7